MSFYEEMRDAVFQPEKKINEERKKVLQKLLEKDASNIRIQIAEKVHNGLYTVQDSRRIVEGMVAPCPQGFSEISIADFLDGKPFEWPYGNVETYNHYFDEGTPVFGFIGIHQKTIRRIHGNGLFRSSLDFHDAKVHYELYNETEHYFSLLKRMLVNDGIVISPIMLLTVYKKSVKKEIEITEKCFEQKYRWGECGNVRIMIKYKMEISK